MPKAMHRIMNENPLVVYLTKNGRPIGNIAARAYCAKMWPDVQFVFSRNDHSTVGEVKIYCDNGE